MTTENTTTKTNNGKDVYERSYELLNSGVSYTRAIEQLVEEGYTTPTGRKLKASFLNNAIPVLRKRFGYKGKTSTRTKVAKTKVAKRTWKTKTARKTTGSGVQTLPRTTRIVPTTGTPTGRDSVRFVQFIDTLPLNPQRREAVLSAYFAD